MKLKNKQLWNDCVEKNRDPYGSAVIRYCKKWAELMELEISKGKTVYECANATSNQADTEGITGFMHGCALSTLSEVWEYGEDLRKWYNGEYNYNDDGVVNPAVITVKE
ncbi:MAG: hypothetical protein IJH34_07525, partial [Romboutsia sp.]|nr:hypothetical protein [Romboutsia sp.]